MICHKNNSPEEIKMLQFMVSTKRQGTYYCYIFCLTKSMIKYSAAFYHTFHYIYIFVAEI